jgi:hypothetical protein
MSTQQAVQRPIPGEEGIEIDRGEPARAKIAALLTAMQITRVIWVDDQHSVETTDATVDEIAEQVFDDSILLGVWAVLNSADLGVPSAIDQTSPEQTGELLRDRWAGWGEDLRDELTQVVRTNVRGRESSLSASEANSEAESAALVGLFEDNPATLITLSLAQWREQRSSLVADTQQTLLLVDRDFSIEGGANDDGERILADLGRDEGARHFVAALFTRTADNEDTERDLAGHLAEKHGLDFSRLTVIGKFRTDESLPDALRVLLLATELEAYRALIKVGLEEAHHAAVDRIDALHRYTLLGTVAAATNEGSYELDLAVRVAVNAWQPVLLTRLRDSERAPAILQPFRHDPTRNAYLDAGDQNAQIREVLWQDLFQTADHLSALHLPIEVGDIFKTYPVGKTRSTAGPRHWILLAQACDLSVRSNGHRANNLSSVMLTEFKAEIGTPKRDADGSQRRHEVGAFSQESDRTWYVDASRRIVVPMLALDATVFAPDGCAKLPVPDPTAPVASGWMKRREGLNVEAKLISDRYFEHADLIKPRNHTDSPKQWNKLEDMIANSLAFGHSDVKLGVPAVVDSTTKQLEYGIQRVGRLSSHKAAYLLSVVAGYQNRPADDAVVAVDRK